MKNKCVTCGKPCHRKWCTQACNATTRRKGQTLQCLNCEASFYVRATDARKGGGKFCSLDCRKAYKAKHAVNYLKVGRKAVHRIVVEKKLGRPLANGEVVHHLDGNMHNNAPDNLIVLPNQSAHMRHEVAEGKRTISHELAVHLGKLSGKSRRRNRALCDQSSKPENNG